MVKYPTKEEIMAREHKFKPGVIEAVKEWKRTSWKEDKNEDIDTRIESFRVLLDELIWIYESPVQVEFVSDYPTCCYNSLTKTIYINQSTSIISLFHEFAHHLYGPSELKACRWSVWLFKKTFPKSFNKLKWKGHMLIK